MVTYHYITCQIYSWQLSIDFSYIFCIFSLQELPLETTRCAMADLFAAADIQLTKVEVPDPPAVQIRREFVCYKEGILSYQDQGPLQDCHRLISLVPLVLSHICLQDNSVAREWVFSDAGDVSTPERSQLDPEKADMLIPCKWTQKHTIYVFVFRIVDYFPTVK